MPRPPLQLPALRAHMGDWVYYCTFLRMEDIATRVSLAKDIHPSKRLGELMQRQLMESTHAESIKNYLIHQAQRFFNAIVVGVYGGAPKWLELDIKPDPASGLDALPRHVIGALGLLVLDGAEQLFAIDGQHRTIGIKKAIAQAPALKDEEVSAIFVAHRTDEQGLERTRRLFSTLNRYAKPVSKMEIVALDEDDVIAIIARRLVEQYPLFRDFTSIKRTKAMPLADKTNLTSIVALYDAMDRYFAKSGREWHEFRKVRPSDQDIDAYYKRAVQLWNLLRQAFPPLQELTESKPEDRVAERYRNRDGGHLLFRPAGLFLVIAAIRHLRDEGRPLKEAVDAIHRIPMTLSEYPWEGLLWDATNRRMLVRGENIKVARRLLVYGAGGDLGALRTDSATLKKEYAGILNRQPTDVKLRRWT